MMRIALALAAAKTVGSYVGLRISKELRGRDLMLNPRR